MPVVQQRRFQIFQSKKKTMFCTSSAPPPPAIVSTETEWDSLSPLTVQPARVRPIKLAYNKPTRQQSW